MPDDSKMSSLLRLLMFVPLCCLVACGAAQVPALHSPHTTIAPAVTPSPTPTPTPSPTVPPGGAAPARLSGEWTEVVVSGGLIEDLTLVLDTYRLGSASGNIHVIRNQIYFYNGPCDGVGLYQWAVTRGVLHFTLLNDDPCGRRMDLDNRSYTKVTG